ncbi:MAG: hypothetical protein ACXWO3_15370, partial [Isosphaeraceae bacterium]
KTSVTRGFYVATNDPPRRQFVNYPRFLAIEEENIQSLISFPDPDVSGAATITAPGKSGEIARYH